MTTDTQTRTYNFSAGPSALPLAVLERAQEEFLCYPGAGASIMEISHRGGPFTEVIQAATQNIKTLLNVPDNYRLLFLQGGATLQFAMLPMNFLQGTGKTADYINAGSWGDKAIKEAKLFGDVHVAWSGKDDNYARMPRQEELQLSPNAAYVHFTSNETIQGIEAFDEPLTGDAPLICDASSNILSRPLDISKYGMIYAGAQKNIGPSGVAVVIIREDLLERVPENLATLLDYKVMADGESLVNTPPTFGIYMIKLVTDWLLNDMGGLSAMEARNIEKANTLYNTIDNSGGFYRGHAEVASRSRMNVTWTLKSGDLEKEMVAEATANGLDALKGHRSVGGLRASIYNAMTQEGVQALADFMADFMARKG